MTYDESISFLNSLADLEKKSGAYRASQFDPQRVRRMLKTTGLSFDEAKIIHIAGTKGKGSVAFYTANLLRLTQKGRVGLYTSPHIFRVNERIKIDLKDITDKEFSSLVTRYAKLIKRNRATAFDAMTFIAMVHFISGRCEYIVLETGLGGRLDSTNFCKPVLSVITSVGYDHTAILGKKLSQIAAEKAGIIKKNVPVLCAKQEDEALKKIKDAAEKAQSEMFYFNDLVKYRVGKRNRSGSGFNAFIWFGRKEQEWKKLKLASLGDSAIENFLLSVYAVLLAGLSVSASALRRAAALKIPYRMSISGNNLVDVSHNDRSIKLLFDTLIRYVRAKRYHLFLTALSDKEILRIAKVVLEYRNLFHKITVYDFHTYRKSGGKKLYAAIRQLSHAEYVKDVSLLKTSGRDFNVFTGSFYSVSRIVELIGGNR
jgi:dihydrofolate synthase / folylpolyglutamate synthase